MKIVHDKEDMMKLYDIAKVMMVGVVLVLLTACGGSGTSVADQKKDSMYIVGLSSYVDDVRVEDTLVLGKKSTISTLGLKDTDIKVQVSTKRGTKLVSALQLSEAMQTIDFTVPVNTVDGNLSIVKGENILQTVSYRVHREYEPFITSLSPDTAKPGDTVVITGKNLSEPLSVVSEWGNIDINVSLSGNQVSFVLPKNTRTGYLHLQTEQMRTNSLYLMVERHIDIKVDLAEGVDFDAGDIGFALAMKEYTLDTNYQATLPVGNSLQQLFATVEQSDGTFSMLYSTVLLPDMMGTIEIDAHSTAISLMFIGMGITDSNLESSQWRPLYDYIASNAKVLALSQYIADLQKRDFSSWIDNSDETLKTKFQDALKDVMQNYTTKQAHRMTKVSGSNERSLVVIKQDPDSGKIYIDDAVSGKKLNNGSVAIVNKTRLYLSLAATSRKNGETINEYKHIQDLMNMKQKGLIAPSSGGILNSENVQKIKLEGEDANVQIIAAGYKGETDNTAILSALRARTMIEGVAIPTVDILLSVLTGKETPKSKVTFSLVDYHYKSQPYKNIIKGMTVIFEAVYKNGTFFEDFTHQFFSEQINWRSIVKTFFYTPLEKGITSCTSLIDFNSGICGQTLQGVSIMLGLDPKSAAKTIGYAVASNIQKRILRRAVAAAPIVGWAIALGFIVDEAVGYASNASTIACTIKDAYSSEAELNAEIEFKLKITEVKPLCLAISPETTETALYVSGERFLLEDGSSPKLAIGGQDAKNLDTVTETKVYGVFDAQKLIEDGSQLQLVFLRYDELLVEHEKFIQIVDQRDSGVYFNQIEPNKAAKGATVKLKGCGWIPLNDVKVFFSKEDSTDEYVEAEILSKKPDILTVKVPADAKSGVVYVTAGDKVTKKLLFDVNPFSLNKPDAEDTLAKKDPFVWYGHMLDNAAKVYFTDHQNTKREGTITQQDADRISVTVPSGLAYGTLRIYAEDSDGIETNEITLPYVPLGVDADPSSQTFEESITVTLTQGDGVDIYYRIDDGAEETYTAPIVLNAADAMYTSFSLVTWASVKVDDTEYRSDESEYQYTLGTSTGCASYEALVDGECKSIFEGYVCPLVYDAALDDDTDSNWSIVFPLRDKDGDGIYEDDIYCGYTVYSEGHIYHETHHIDREEILRIYYYESGAVKTISANTRSYPDLNALGIEPRYEWYRETGELWGQAFYDTTGAFSYSEEYYITGERYRQYEWGGGPDIDSNALSGFSSYRNGFWKQYYKNDVMQYELHFVHGMREGIKKEWYESRNLKYEVLYVKDSKNGWETYYFDEADKKRVETYYIDTFTIDGLQTFWYQSGKKNLEIHWEHNKKNGIEKRWYISGVLKSEHSYVNNIKWGAWRDYYDQILEQLSSEIFYNNGKKDGISKTYYASGQIHSEKHYLQDKLRDDYRTWYENGQLEHQSFYVDDKLHGQSKGYSSGGIMTSCDIYSHGVRTGSCMP